MFSYSLKDVATLMAGFLLLTQGVSGAAVPQPGFPSGPLTCAATYSAAESPLASDCKLALAKIAPVKPQVCAAVMSYESNRATVGTCTIRTFSAAGSAHCLDGNLIIIGVEAILSWCTSGVYTGGEAKWSTTGTGEGVRLIRAA